MGSTSSRNCTGPGVPNYTDESFLNVCQVHDANHLLVQQRAAVDNKWDIWSLSSDAKLHVETHKLVFPCS